MTLWKVYVWNSAWCKGTSMDLFFLWTLDLILCDREHYHSQQLVLRSGQVGHLSPMVVFAIMSAFLRLLMQQSSELPFRAGGIAFSPHFTNLIPVFLVLSTLVQQVTSTPGFHCERAAQMVWYLFLIYCSGGARHWQSNLNGRLTALQTGSLWFWMWQNA